MKMIKFIITMSLLCSFDVKALETMDIDKIIDDVRQEYNDSVLILETCKVIYDNYEEITPKDFAILYNYLMSCKNEEGSEGIYDRITWDLVYSNKFFHSVCSYISDVKKTEKSEFFNRWLDKFIIRYRFILCSDCEEKYETKTVDEVVSYIVKHLPKELFEVVYKSDTNKIKDIVSEYIDDL